MSNTVKKVELFFKNDRNYIYILTDFEENKYLYKLYADINCYQNEKRIYDLLKDDDFVNYKSNVFNLTQNGLLFEFNDDMCCLIDFEINANNYKKIIYQIIKSIKKLHEKNIVHRDIKLDNIIVRKRDLKIFIIDFEFSVQKNTSSNNLPIAGSLEYMDPNMLRKKYFKQKITFEDCLNYDIYSLGVTLHCFLTGDHIYEMSSNRDILYENVISNYRNRNFKYLINDKNIIKMVQSLTNINIDKRMTLENAIDLMKGKYFFAQ